MNLQVQALGLLQHVDEQGKPLYEGAAPSEADVLWLVKRGTQQVARYGASGPVAVLLDGNSQGPLLRSYAEYGREHSHLTVGVFDDPDAARQWLADHSHP